MKLTRVGVDLAKLVFQVHGVDRAERPVWCQRLKRGRWITELERNVELGCEIGMEACGGAHHWARVLQSKGYRVRLIAPQFVKPYVKSNKTDANDAQAVCEAMSRPSMRFVAVKTIEQQDIQAVHRVRASLIRDRGAKANQLRALVYEYGLVAPREIAALRRAVPAWLEDASNGLTPRQHSSGNKERILGISKRGDSYVRTLLIHGARSALRTAEGKNDRLSRWALALAQRSHANVAATALANKMARVAWAMLKHGTAYEPNGLAA